MTSTGKRDILIEAIGLIDDELIADARSFQKTRRTSPLVRFSAIAASFALVIGIVYAAFFAGIDGADDPNVDISAPSPYYACLAISENLWDKDSFSAFSLIYADRSALSVLGTDIIFLSADRDLSSSSLSIGSSKPIKVDSLIKNRYVMFTENRTTVFYDTLEKRTINLDERIIGDKKQDIAPFIAEAVKIANGICPGIMDTEKNREILGDYITKLYSATKKVDMNAYSPDTDFIDLYPENEKYRDLSETERKDLFLRTCISANSEAIKILSDEYIYAPYRTEVFATDTENGSCMIRVCDIVGNAIEHVIYSVTDDSVKELPDDIKNTIKGTMSGPDSVFRFSYDGKICTVVSPEFHYSDPYADGVYIGEKVGVFFLDENTVYRYDNENIKGASEAYFSDDGKVVYFKKMSGELPESEISLSKERFDKISESSHEWVFCVRSGDEIERTVLEGNFIRFCENGNSVIMENGGEYSVYSLTKGKDITDRILDYKVKLSAHECIHVYTQNKYLYAKDMFSDLEPVVIGRASDYFVTDDGAFAFLYLEGASHVTCVNIASLEKCKIRLDEELYRQITSAKDPTLNILYSQSDNTVSISFYES